MNTITVKTKIDASTAQKLDEIQRNYGFRSRYQLIKTIVKHYVSAIDRKASDDNIDSMFTDDGFNYER